MTPAATAVSARPGAGTPGPVGAGRVGRFGAAWVLAVTGAALATVLVAAVLVLRPGSALVVAGAVLALVAALVVQRVPHLAAAVLVVFLQVQATLKFYVSDLFGPAKDAATLLLVVAVLAPVALTRLGRTRIDDRWLVAALAALVGVYALDPAGSHTAGWSPTVRLVVESFGLFLAGWLSRDPARSWRWVARAMIGCGVFETALGLAQQVLGAERLVLGFGLAYGSQVRTTSGGQLRSFGTFDDPFNYGVVTTIALVLAVLVLRRGWLRLVLVAVLAVGVLVSVDRTMIALLPLLLLLWLVLRGGAVTAGLLVAAAVAAGVGFLALPTAPTAPQVATTSASTGNFLLTLNGRTETWSQVVRGPQDVLFGRGVGVLGSGLARSQQTGTSTQGRYVDGVAPVAADNSQLTSLDNSYLAVVSDTGVLGLALLLVAGSRVWRTLARGVRARSGTALAGMAVLLVIGVDGLTRTSLTAFPAGFLGLLVLGTALGAVRVEQAGVAQVRGAQVRGAQVRGGRAAGPTGARAGTPAPARP